MNKSLLWTTLVASGLGVLGGYWLASRPAPPASPPVQAEKQPSFYRHPMNPSITSPVPTKDEMGMNYIPVYADEPASAPSAPPPAQSERKILYYRNPMGLTDTSPVPKKDSMGMDYIPVYADEESQEGAAMLRVSTEKIQRLGVKTARVEKTEIAKTVRSVGIIEADERRLYNVTLRFDGFIENLFVNATGQSVTRGQPLFELYSPDLISAQNEYLFARQSQKRVAEGRDWVQSGITSLADGSLERLKNWGIAAEDLSRLQQGQILRTVVVRSPASGVILEKTAVAGARAMAGDTLFKIADLSTVWAMAEIYEQDIGSIRHGQTARVTLDAYPGKTFTGKVGFVYPMLNAATRTVKVRVELANPGQLLKPMMYAQLQIDSQKHRALTVPTSAVLESGRHTLVLVDRDEGRFEPRPVEAGLRGEEAIEILKGLREHERVVVSANFLIDAESNLKAAVSAFETVDTKQDGTVTAEPSQSHGEHSHQRGR